MASFGQWLGRNWLMVLLVFVPISFGLEYGLHITGLPIFLTSAAAIIPLAALMGAPPSASRSGSAKA